MFSLRGKVQTPKPPRFLSPTTTAGAVGEGGAKWLDTDGISRAEAGAFRRKNVEIFKRLTSSSYWRQ
jgi:hypothetical protein